MHDEWTKVISGDRLVKFTYFDLPTGPAFMTAQIAAHEVVYSIISERIERPFSRVGVAGRFDYELRPGPPERLIIRDDPVDALGRRLKLNKTTSLKAAFDAAHKDGMDAIQRGDYDAFGNAIDRERKIIDAIDTTIKHASKRRK